MKNATREDAHRRIVSARLGCFVNAKREYLVALRNLLFLWIDNIEVKIKEIDYVGAYRD